MTYKMSYGKSTIKIDVSTGKITGDTYQMRSCIKEEFPSAKWNPQEKCWICQNAEERIEEIRDYLTRCYKLAVDIEEEGIVAEETTKKISTYRLSRPCPRCGTYCYGDCRAI